MPLKTSRKEYKMPRSSFANIDCPIALAAEQLADKWKFVIIRNAFNGMRRFDDFALQLGVASNVLTRRLSELVDVGILKKVPLEDDRRAFEYRLTPKGYDLFPMLIFLAQWSDRWIKKKGGPRLNLAYGDAAEPLLPVQVKTASGATVTPQSLKISEGAGKSSVYREIRQLVRQRAEKNVVPKPDSAV